jgi:hypothetical protein
MIDDNTSCIDEDVLLAAISKGDLPLLTLLIDKLRHIVSDNIDAFEDALCKRDAALLASLTGLTNIPWSDRMYKEAIKVKRLDIFTYLNEQGCPLRDSVILNTARDINILRYVHEQVVTYKLEGMLDEALLEGTLETIAYLYERGYPTSVDTDLYIIETNDVEIVKYFHEKGYIWSDVEMLLDEMYDSEVAQYCHDNNIPKAWSCLSLCVHCMNNRKSKIEELWDMEDITYNNHIQWLPRETMEDVRDLLIVPEVISDHESDEEDEEDEE